MWLSRLLGLLGLSVFTLTVSFSSPAHARQPQQPAPAKPPAAPTSPATKADAPKADTPKSEAKGDASKPETKADAPKADPKATEALKKAIDQLDSKKIGYLQLNLWQQLAVWQQSASPGMKFLAEGDYLSGPDHRLRLNLKIHIGGLGADMTVVSDGADLWTAIASSGHPRTVTKWSLKDVQQALNNPNMIPQVRDGFFQSQCFSGIVPVLDNLRQQMVMTKQESLQWQGHDVLKLTAVWNADLAKDITTAANGSWPPLVPRECRLFLDAKTFWPYRLEWWGPIPPNPSDSLLIETEYRDPHLIKTGAKPPDQFAKAFAFDPGPDKVTDQTKDFLDTFKPFINPAGDAGKGTAPKK